MSGMNEKKTESIFLLLPITLNRRLIRNRMDSLFWYCDIEIRSNLGRGDDERAVDLGKGNGGD